MPFRVSQESAWRARVGRGYLQVEGKIEPNRVNLEQSREKSGMKWGENGVKIEGNRSLRERNGGGLGLRGPNGAERA